MQSEARVDGKRLRVLREERGLAQREVAERSGVSQPEVSKLERDARPTASITTISKIAATLGVRAEDLVVGGGERRERGITFEDALRIMESVRPIQVPEVEVPVSAGPGVFVEVDYWAYTPEAGERNHKFRVFRVTGTCMEPRIREDDRVLVDESVEPQHGNVVVAWHEGQILVKTLVSENGHLLLKAEQGQEPLTVNADTVILGVVKQGMYRV